MSGLAQEIVCILLSKRLNFSSFDAFEMFDLVHLVAVSFSVFLLLFQMGGPACSEEIAKILGREKPPSKLATNHPCGCTGKGRSEHGRRCEGTGGGGSEVKAGMEKWQLLCQARQGVRALSRDWSD